MPAALCRFLLEVGMAPLAQPRHGGRDKFALPCGVVDNCLDLRSLQLSCFALMGLNNI